MFWFRKKGVDPSTRDVQVVHAALAQSFTHVRRDVQNLYDWLRHMHNQHEQQKHQIDEHRQVMTIQRKEIEDLKQILNDIPKSKDEIRVLVDEYYRIEGIIDRIQKVEDLVQKVHNNHEQLKDATSMINNKQDVAKYKEILVPPHLEESQKASMVASSDDVFKRLAEISDSSNQLMLQKLSEISDKLDAKKAPQSALREKIMSRVARNSKEYVKTMIRQLIEKYGKTSGLQLREIVVEEQGLSSKSSFYRILAEIEQEQEVSVIRDGKEKLYVSKQVRRESTQDWGVQDH
ncbi:MAG: hypothetical protein AABX52_03850 [Nanoarchaeota archaeon]